MPEKNRGEEQLVNPEVKKVEGYKRQLLAMADEYKRLTKNKPDKNFLNFLSEFFGLMEDMSPDLLYSGLAYFNQTFFKLGISPIDLEVDPGYEAFVKRGVNEKFTILLMRAIVENEQKKYVKAVEEAKQLSLEFKKAKAAAPPLEKFKYNQEKAKELGLVEMELRGNIYAQDIISDIISGKYDVGRPEDQSKIIDMWMLVAPELPLPFFPHQEAAKRYHPYTYFRKSVPKGGNTFLLEGLRHNLLVQSNILTYKRIDIDLAENSVVLADGWKEGDLANGSLEEKASGLFSSNLLRALGIDQPAKMPCEIKRDNVDRALWVGDPAQRLPTFKQTEVLVSLGLYNTQFEIRCISISEYLRGALKNNWGDNKLWTQVDGYYGKNNGAALVIGNYDFGGISALGFMARDRSEPNCAVRLVIAKKRQ